jgi:L-amino acid N-acyltransferase YncA
VIAATGIEMIVRDLRAEDWPQAAAIYRDGMRGGMATFETEVPSWEEWSAAHPIRLAAELDERLIVGWAACGPVSSRWAYRGVHESSVYVAREFRGHGLGRQLMERLVDESEAAGVWTLQSAIFPENEASLKLHRAVGFRVVGVRKRIGKRDGLWRDTVIVERRSEAIA